MTSNARRYAAGMIVTTAIAVVVAVIVNIAYTQHVQDEASRKQAELRAEADHRWCELLATLDTNDPPATTPRGLVVQRQLHELRVALGCVK